MSVEPPNSKPAETPTRLATPPFEEGLVGFLHFIEKQGMSRKLVWVFRENVTSYDRRVWIHSPNPQDDLVLSHKYYEYGRTLGLGVALEILCKVGDRSAAYVRVPVDITESEQGMFGPLTCRVPVDTPIATEIVSNIHWRWRSWLNASSRLPSLTSEVKRRSEVERLVGHDAR